MLVPELDVFMVFVNVSPDVGLWMVLAGRSIVTVLQVVVVLLAMSVAVPVKLYVQSARQELLEVKSRWLVSNFERLEL